MTWSPRLLRLLGSALMGGFIGSIYGATAAIGILGVNLLIYRDPAMHDRSLYTISLIFGAIWGARVGTGLYLVAHALRTPRALLLAGAFGGGLLPPVVLSLPAALGAFGANAVNTLFTVFLVALFTSQTGGALWLAGGMAWRRRQQALDLYSAAIAEQVLSETPADSQSCDLQPPKIWQIVWEDGLRYVGGALGAAVLAVTTFFWCSDFEGSGLIDPQDGMFVPVLPIIAWFAAEGGPLGLLARCAKLSVWLTLIVTWGFLCALGVCVGFFLPDASWIVVLLPFSVGTLWIALAAEWRNRKEGDP